MTAATTTSMRKAATTTPMGIVLGMVLDELKQCDGEAQGAVSVGGRMWDKRELGSGVW